MMATYADPAGDGIRPSVDALQAALGRGRTTVTGALKELRESGWITQTKRGNNLQQTASTYVLSIPAKVR